MKTITLKNLSFVNLATAGGREPEELAGQLFAVRVKRDESFLHKLWLTTRLEGWVVRAHLVALCGPATKTLN